MRKRAKMYSGVAIVLPALFGLATSLSATARSSCAAGKILASSLQNGVVVVLMNENGKLTAGNNSLCLALRNVETGDPAEVQNVRIDVILLVGKIQEKPITAQLTPDSVGHYRGNVDLGRQYYKPASYYVIIHYIDLTAKKRKTRFHLTVSRSALLPAPGVPKKRGAPFALRLWHYKGISVS